VLFRSILDKARAENVDAAKAEDVNNIPGIGLEAQVAGYDMKVTSVSYLEDNGIAYDKEQFGTLAGQGNSVSFLVIEEENSGIIAQGDQLKPGSKKMIEALLERNITRSEERRVGKEWW